jgi:hypothetical protein|uniref:Uncharacterized protein n=1 Tax=Kumanoa mahlacensis TaxID=1196387 RepID=A0A8K1YU24_9FLOR|nr:hypothetical protein [Kumanoa mahlacensis]
MKNYYYPRLHLSFLYLYKYDSIDKNLYNILSHSKKNVKYKIKSHVANSNKFIIFSNFLIQEWFFGQRVNIKIVFSNGRPSEDGYLLKILLNKLNFWNFLEVLLNCNKFLLYCKIVNLMFELKKNNLPFSFKCLENNFLLPVTKEMYSPFFHTRHSCMNVYFNVS